MLLFLTGINFISIVLGVCILLLLILRRGRLLAYRILAVWMFILVLFAILSLLINTQSLYLYPHFLRVQDPFLYLLGPASYLFFRTLLFSEKKFKKWDWLHLIPFVLHLIELIPFYSGPLAAKIELINLIELNRVYKLANMQEGLFLTKWHLFLKEFSLATYLFFTIKMFIKFQKISFVSAFKENKPLLNFTKWLLINKAAGFIISTLALIFYAEFPNFAMHCLEISNTSLFVIVIVSLFYNPQILYGPSYDTFTINKLLNLEKKQKAITAELKSSNANLRSSIESETETNIFLDVNFKILHFNHLADTQTLQMFERRIAVGEDFRSYLHEGRKKDFFTYFNKAVSGDRCTFEMSVSLNGLDDHSWYQFEFIPIYNESKQLIGISLCTKDIVKTKAQELKNLAYEKELGDIAWRESHLLRAPIANLLGITNMLNKPEENLSHHDKSLLLKHIESEVKKLDEVIHSIVKKASERIS